MRKNSRRGAKLCGNKNRPRERIRGENSKKSMSLTLNTSRPRRKGLINSDLKRKPNGRPGRRKLALSNPMKRSKDKKPSRPQLRRKRLRKRPKRRQWRLLRKRTVELPLHVRLNALRMPSAKLLVRSPRRHKRFLNTAPQASLALESLTKYAQRPLISRSKLTISRMERVQLPPQMLPQRPQLLKQVRMRLKKIRLLLQSEELQSSSEASDDLNETKPSRHI